MTDPLLTPGYWCECWTHDLGTGAPPALVGSIDVETATQAVRWIRVALRTLVSALEPEPFERAWDWLSLEYATTVTTLTAGKPCALTITHARTTIQWTARPVHFAKLAHRRGVNLPACAEQFTQPTRPTE
ncbi:hypothetical protein ACIBCM_33245 [Streptomyces sp. NPDC051018]|uniref:hypothetical protein n=1 Tax=Streptomyces sp. NPDC051018 TaxID=3365639 RepID=UPI0037935212